MKAFVIALLFSLTTAAEVDTQIVRPPYQSAVQMRHQDTDSSSESSDDEENVQLGNPERTYEVHESKKGNAELGRYERVTTARFSADSDDIFMRSMIENYALEGKKCDEDEDGKPINCAPDGTFWMNESSFSKAWAHFDVNKTGMVEVLKMPQFMRFIAS